ncbi:hypothetical protein HBB16_12540 [Pseudonocardia sp. MCCB 268]|nr:hypothetical protein [Pseudonocardia cytotoxica]
MTAEAAARAARRTTRSGQAFGGLYSVSGEPDHANLTGTILADVVTGLTTASGCWPRSWARPYRTGDPRRHLADGVGQRALTTDAEPVLRHRRGPTQQTRHPQARRTSHARRHVRREHRRACRRRRSSGATSARRWSGRS